jgi:hypothetical protein
MRSLIIIEYCASLAFLVYHTLQRDKLLASTGLFITILFLDILRTSNRAIKIAQDQPGKSREWRKIVTNEIRGMGLTPSQFQINFALITVQMFGQARTFALAAGFLALGGFFLRRFEGVSVYVTCFGVLALAMFAIPVTAIFLNAPANRPL